jgi:hypothetical protein
MQISAPPIIIFPWVGCEGQQEVPNQLIDSSLAPMWKLIGRLWWLQASQSGFQ